uniref:Uncharacterized protein n=1 Tax=Siphoviridae sp. ct4fm14 TaxID=2825331 RepID=A0A8S5UTA3_9CAUD|nr:MAG TPA: hypothetical protein [Siphoviridae sp. ct4fm14]
MQGRRGNKEWGLQRRIIFLQTQSALLRLRFSKCMML